MPKTNEKTGTRQRVMVCEDEIIVAMDLEDLIEEFGYAPVGPFTSVRSGMEFIQTETPDIAVLDVNLKDGQVFPLADKLDEMGVRLIFHSGHVQNSEIMARYPSAANCHKPINSHIFKSVLDRVAEAAGREPAEDS